MLNDVKREGRRFIHLAISLLTIWAGAQFNMFKRLESELARTEKRLAACELKVKTDTASEARLHE